MPYRSAPTPPPLPDRLRRLAILKVRGRCHKQIAMELDVSLRTVDYDWAEIRRLLGIDCVGKLASLCVRWGWLTDDELFGPLPDGFPDARTRNPPPNGASATPPPD